MLSTRAFALITPTDEIIPLFEYAGCMVLNGIFTSSDVLR